METNKKQIYVFGHKNPDTDSICAAIGYAWLKNQLAAKKEDTALNLIQLLKTEDDV